MHHANLLVGSHEWAMAHIPEDEKKPGEDVIHHAYERMTIDNARTLIHDASLRAVSRPHRTFILSCSSILPEAQNALLKLLEDAGSGVRFFFIIPRDDVLLRTLRSRFHLLATERPSLGSADFDEFLRMEYTERLSTIADKLENEDSAWVRSLLQGAAVYAAAKKHTPLIRDVLAIESYSTLVGSSKKMLLEHLALSLPREVG